MPQCAFHHGIPDLQDDRFKNENVFNNASLAYAKYAGYLLDKNSNMTLKLSPSLFDSLNTMTDPAGEIANKLSIPVQVLYNTIMEYVADEKIGKNTNNSVIKQYIKNHYATYDTQTKHTNTGIAWIDSLHNWIQDNKGTKAGGGNYSIQSMARGKYNLINTLAQLVPFLGTNLTQFDSAIENFARSGKYEDLFMPSLFGAIKTSNKKQYTNKKYTYSNNYRGYSKRYYGKRVYHKKVYPGTPRVNQSMTYRFGPYGQGYAYYTGYSGRTYPSGKQPYSKYKAFVSQIQKPNYTHRAVGSNISGNMQSIPQYLYSYVGKNRQGKSKPLSWIRMSTRYKVKNTLRRYASL